MKNIEFSSVDILIFILMWMVEAVVCNERPCPYCGLVSDRTGCSHLLREEARVWCMSQILADSYIRGINTTKQCKLLGWLVLPHHENFTRTILVRLFNSQCLFPKFCWLSIIPIALHSCRIVRVQVVRLQQTISSRSGRNSVCRLHSDILESPKRSAGKSSRSARKRFHNVFE